MRYFTNEIVLHGLGKDIEGLGQQVSDYFPGAIFALFLYLTNYSLQVLSAQLLSI